MDEHPIEWARSINAADYPNISLDFTLLEQSCGLKFDDQLKKKIIFNANFYKAFKDETETNSQQPISKIRKKLKTIKTASKLLAEAINDFAYGSNSPGAEASRVIYSLLKSNNTLGWIEPGRLANFLDDMSVAADRANAAQAPLGRKKDEQTRLLIQELHKVFTAAGGNGLGCFTDGATASGYAGPFYALVCELIRQIDGGPMTSGLGKMIYLMFYQESSLLK